MVSNGIPNGLDGLVILPAPLTSAISALRVSIISRLSIVSSFVTTNTELGDIAPEVEGKDSFITS